MPAKGASTALTPIRLQSVKKLHIRRPSEATSASPCLGPMTSMLNCWASTSSQTLQGSQQASTALNCVALEAALRECMDFAKKDTERKNNVNYHLARLYPSVRGKVRGQGKLK